MSRSRQRQGQGLAVREKASRQIFQGPDLAPSEPRKNLVLLFDSHLTRPRDEERTKKTLGVCRFSFFPRSSSSDHKCDRHHRFNWLCSRAGDERLKNFFRAEFRSSTGRQGQRSRVPNNNNAGGKDNGQLSGLNNPIPPQHQRWACGFVLQWAGGRYCRG